MKGPFFYQHEGRQIGPLTGPELKHHAASGQLEPEDRVWTDEMPAGVSARTIKNLFPAPAPAAPIGPDPITGMPSDAPPPWPAAPPVEKDAPAETPSVAADTVAETWPRKMARVSRVVAQRAGTEFMLTARALALQLRRLTAYIRTWYAARSADQRTLAMKREFGEKLYGAGLGDAALRSQVEQLRERRLSLQAAKSSTKQVDNELRGLFMRLAEPALESPKPPPGLEAEHAAMTNVLEAQTTAQARHQAQRLLPEDRASLLRVGGGTCVALLVVWLAAGWAFSRGSGPPGSVEREVWFDENEQFPRRLAIGTFLGDVPWGEIKMYDEQERLIGDFHYVNGELHGTCTLYYPSGQKFQEGPFVNGKREGVHYTWFENGELAQSLPCHNEVPHGTAAYYYDDGSKFREVNYVNGKAEGEAKGYLPDGRVANITVYKNDEIVSNKDQFEVTPEELALISKRAEMNYTVKGLWMGDSVAGHESASSSGAPVETIAPSYGSSSGDGQQLCLNCNGTGQADCPQCFGTGKRNCYMCNSTGRTVNNMLCFQCNGSGKQNCSFCPIYSGGKVQCPQCFGSGRQ